MNIEVVGRIRPTGRGSGAPNLHPDSLHRLTSGHDGAFFNFQALYSQDTPTHEIFRSSFESQLDLFLSGLNCCVLIAGQSGSGKSYSIAGDGSSSKPGLVTLLFESLFAKLSNDNRYLYESHLNRSSVLVNLQMYEVYNELIKDLLKVPGMGPPYSELDHTAEHGGYVRNRVMAVVTSAAEAVTLFQQAWSRRTEMTSDFGPARNNASIVIQIHLQMQIGDNPQPYKCRFAIVELPGLEKLANDSGQLKIREGPLLNKSITAVKALVSSLSNSPFPDRVITYNESKLTQLLQDELGGNCKSKALICLNAHTSNDILPAILRFCSHVSQVRNYPVANDNLAQGLIAQYRARILDLQQQLGVTSSYNTVTNLNDARDEIRKLQTDNLQLRDENERLRHRLDQLHGKFGSMATTKTDISQQLLMTEEEKLKVSQSLVEMQIENNRIREEAEAAKFELSNKVLALENEVLAAQMERDRQNKASRNAADKLKELEQSYRDLSDEYITLKTNYLALSDEHKKEVARNGELSVELLSLVNAKSALIRRLEGLHVRDHQELGDPSSEVERIKAILDKYNPKKADEIREAQKNREPFAKNLLGNRSRYFHGEINPMENQYEENGKQLENRISVMMKDLHDSRNLARARQQNVAELTAKLLTIQSEKNHLGTIHNRMQHKIKDLNEDYRARLIKYVEDVADAVDRSKSKTNDSNLRAYIEKMLRDIRHSFQQREEQLSQAAQQYRVHLQNVVKKHEQLIVAYKNIQEKVSNLGIDDQDVGPDVESLEMTDQELQSSQRKEICRIREELASAQAELETLRLQLSLTEDGTNDRHLPRDARGSENWASLRKQLREFTLNTQQQLESERAELLSRNQVLEEELRESQEYIDSHLIRYKEELIRLRRLLGMEDDGNYFSPRDHHYSSYKGKTRPRP